MTSARTSMLKRVTVVVVSVAVFVAITFIAGQHVPSLSGSDRGGRELALKDVACVQRCNDEIRACRKGCDDKLYRCVEANQFNPGGLLYCNPEYKSCLKDCIKDHNICVELCPERRR